MNLVHLTYTILGVNAAIDTGKYNDISVNEIIEHIRAGDVFLHVATRIGGDIDLSLLDEETRTDITNSLRSILDAYGGQERRKWGIENNGLCLLLAWINELVQQRVWRD